MSDVVEQLRITCSWCTGCHECKAVMNEAADEIERLRAELAAARANLQVEENMRHYVEEVLGGAGCDVQLAADDRMCELHECRRLLREAYDDPTCTFGEPWRAAAAAAGGGE